MIAAEEVIHTLRPWTRDLARAVRNLELPDRRLRPRFGVVVSVVDLAGGEAERETLPLGLERRTLRVESEPRRLAGAGVELWEPLLRGVDHFEQASFPLKRGDFADGDQRVFDAYLLFRGRARLEDGRLASARGSVSARFERGADAKPDDPHAWELVAWETHPLELLVTERPLFDEVLGRMLPEPADLARARRSIHEELVTRKLLEPEHFEAPHEHFFEGAQDRHPGLAVADVDGDGQDDLYVMARWGPNQLYLRGSEGGWRERAHELGLDLADHASAALFADFDNDGDPDLFLGRTLAPSLYLENVGGRFVDRSERAGAGHPLPSLVGSLSAADVDADGLLDVYVSTYAAQMVVAELRADARAQRELGRALPEGLLAEHLDEADARRLREAVREEGAHIYMNLPGPPNRLLRNLGGGRFDDADTPGPLRAFRNTYQATWADYDGDGDPDVYLAHDFSPNQLLRNDGGAGFVDVTEETGTADVGFGMGVTWGDYDRDGRQDLYVSNMYSKAGGRITRHFEGLDPRFAKMARGNTLFRNELTRFAHVSGHGPGKLKVEETGWSWGGQFADLDNDGYLDLYVPNGYYTAPVEAQVDVDI